MLRATTCLLLALVFLACVGCEQTKKKPPTVVITMATLEALGDFISYEEAQKIIGSPGELLGTETIAGEEHKSYRWYTEGATVTLEFADDKLIGKRQRPEE